MVSSGTLADRAAALTTLVQEDVVHNLSSLESLVSMVKKKGRRESMTAIGQYLCIYPVSSLLSALLLAVYFASFCFIGCSLCSLLCYWLLICSLPCYWLSTLLPSVALLDHFSTRISLVA